MNTLTLSESTVGTEQAGTNIGRFIAECGVLLMKETRDISAIRCNFGNIITISTMILTAMNTNGGSKTFGIRFDKANKEERTEDGAFLDFDESLELISALNFVGTLAQRISGEKRDYTEITYSTKDGIKFGFYQENNTQQAFVNVSKHGSLAFLDMDKLQTIKNILDTARTYLVSKGAEA